MTGQADKERAVYVVYDDFSKAFNTCLVGSVGQMSGQCGRLEKSLTGKAQKVVISGRPAGDLQLAVPPRGQYWV